MAPRNAKTSVRTATSGDGTGQVMKFIRKRKTCIFLLFATQLAICLIYLLRFRGDGHRQDHITVLSDGGHSDSANPTGYIASISQETPRGMVKEIDERSIISSTKAEKPLPQLYMASESRADNLQFSSQATIKTRDHLATESVSDHHSASARTGVKARDRQSSPTPIPFMGNYNCSDKHCTEFLTEKEWTRIRCWMRGSNRFPGNCHFMNGTNRTSVALVSYPGSGNTWVRGLLEQATGICSGAMYCDTSLVSGGFNGENIVSGVVLVAKTHDPGFHKWAQSAILIVRNPLDALVSEYNRRTSGHTGSASKDRFGSNPSWNSYVHSDTWPNHFRYLLLAGTKHGHQVHVVKYEDIKADKMTEIKRMLDFLKVPYSDEALEERMNQDFGKFHRKSKIGADFDHYTPEQRNHVLQMIRKVVDKLKEENNGTTYGIEDYLQ